tara:strand:+ start:299 stop:1198 length:900 start_codon:yes stop_codon:yes gene_type:complete
MTISSHKAKITNLKIEDYTEIDINNWFLEQPPRTKANTISTQILHEAYISKNCNQISIAFQNCVDQKVWESIAYMPSVPSKRRVVKYSPIEWLRQEIGVEPDTFMRSMAGIIPDTEIVSKASISLINLVAIDEPKTLIELSNNYLLGANYMLGWRDIFEKLQSFDKGWEKVSLILNKKIRELISIKGKNNKTSYKVKNISSDNVSVFIRKLNYLIDNPEKCKLKGTTTKKVKFALNRLIRGITATVGEAKKEAGLDKTKKVNCGYSITGKPKNVALRIVRRLGREPAQKIARAIMEVTK